jgi:hypothetical protein
MTTDPGADERRIRRALDARGVSYAPQPPAAPAGDWWDRLYDDEPPAPRAAVPPPEPPRPPKTTVEDTPSGEPRWDWRRLLHWPNLGIKTRLCCALAATAAPILPGGYSTATTWWYCVHQTRHNYGTGYGYALGATALALAIRAVTSRGRRAGLLRVTALAIAAIGFLGATSWTDVVRLFTGAFQ